MNARTAFQLDPLFDASCDATREWREVSCMDGDEDRAEALFSSDFEEESRGADDCGPLREVFDLIGLRVVTATGAVIVIDRRDTLDALGHVTVAALEQAMADSACDE